MFGLSIIEFPDRLFRSLRLLNPLHEHKNIADESKIVWLVIGFFLILFFDNYQKNIHTCKITVDKMLFSLCLLFFALSYLSQVSEFLYFNF